MSLFKKIVPISSSLLRFTELAFILYSQFLNKQNQAFDRDKRDKEIIHSF